MKRYLEIDDSATFLAEGINIELDGDDILDLPTLEDLLAPLRKELVDMHKRATKVCYCAFNGRDAIKLLDKFCEEERNESN